VKITRTLRGLDKKAVVGARVAQGECEFPEASEGEKRDIVEAWNANIGALLEKGKAKGKKTDSEADGSIAS
jgi:hypothetical protein